MKVTNNEMAKMLLPGKIQRFEKKISEGDITFDDCGLDIKKNFLQMNDTLLIDDADELEQYCTNLCAECPSNNCAVFTISNDHYVSFALKTDRNEKGSYIFDWFSLDENWHCWHFISIEERFNLSAYGVLCEVSPGEWITITK